ncbi:MAG: hypothetical protein K6E68_07285, partial [Lachnospiraceae bacterium]|nr:hypothetical protein [Lachnospiraceae bacterium]
ADLSQGEYELGSYEKTEWTVGSTAVTLPIGSSTFTLRYDKNGVDDIRDSVLVLKGTDCYDVSILAVETGALDDNVEAMAKVSVTGTTTAVPDTYFDSITDDCLTVRIPMSSIGSGNTVVIKPDLPSSPWIYYIPLSSTSPAIYAETSNDPGSQISFTTNSTTELGLHIEEAGYRINASGMGSSNSARLYTASGGTQIGSTYYYDFESESINIPYDAFDSNKSVYVDYRTALTSDDFDWLPLNTTDYSIVTFDTGNSDFMLMKFMVDSESVYSTGISASRVLGGGYYRIRSDGFTKYMRMVLYHEVDSELVELGQYTYNGNNAFDIPMRPSATLEANNLYVVKIINETSWTVNGGSYVDVPISANVSKRVNIADNGYNVKVENLVDSEVIRVSLLEGSGDTPWVISDGTKKAVWYSDSSLASLQPYIDLSSDGTATTVTVATAASSGETISGADKYIVKSGDNTFNYTLSSYSGPVILKVDGDNMEILPNEPQTASYWLKFYPSASSGQMRMDYVHPTNYSARNGLVRSIATDQGGEIGLKYEMPVSNEFEITASAVHVLIYIAENKYVDFTRVASSDPSRGFKLVVDPNAMTVSIGLVNSVDYNSNYKIYINDTSYTVDSSTYCIPSMNLSSFTDISQAVLSYKE